MNLKGFNSRMVLRIRKKADNRIFKVYLLAMFALMVARYLMKVEVPAFAFLMVSILPIWWGTRSDQLAFAASCIPLSIAFQYKYALLILSVVILVKNRGRVKWSGVLPIVILMMVWELWHAFYGNFSYVEYLRDFAELLLLGVVSSVELHEVDHKLVIRGLSISVVGVCMVMLIMQLQQFGFNLVAVFLRSARSFRFGEDNMEAGKFAINFNSNNLGFVCNLATCGVLLLAVRKEHRWSDIVLMVCSAIFTLMTLSRAAIICLVLLFAGYLLFTGNDLAKRIAAGVGAIAIALLTVFLVQTIFPTVFENITERFQRTDVLNGRGALFSNYNQFMLSSPWYLLFGIGMQEIYTKVVRYVPVSSVPHMGLQEVCVAWGLVGLTLFCVMLWRVVTVSRKYAGGKRQMYQYMPLVLTLVFTTAGQLLTSSRALMALTFAYVCLCVKEPQQDTETEMESA